jgi:6-pyruvoyltetrahydropterin/6-carboxytetrahydropterin synthase
MERKPLLLSKRAHFSAAHRLANRAFSEAKNQAVYGHCFRHHGHNYLLEVTVRGVPDPATGMVMDLATLEATIDTTVLDLLDHRDLDVDVPALSGTITTGENLAQAVWKILSSALPSGALYRVAVIETAKNRFEYFGDEALPEGVM